MTGFFSTLLRQVAEFVVLLLPVAVFVFMRSAKVRTRKRASLAHAFYENFGLLHQHQTFVFIMLPAVSVVLVFAIVRLLLNRAHVGEKWVVLGFGIACTGILPFMATGYDVLFIGVGDRANCISSMGVALCIAGCFQVVLPYAVAAMGAASVFAICMIPLHVSVSLQWLHATRSVVHAGDALIATNPVRPIQLLDDGAPVPGATLGLNAAVELRQYMESGWRTERVEVVIRPTGNTNEGAGSDLTAADRMRLAGG